MSSHELLWSTSADEALLLTGNPSDGEFWFSTLADSATFGDPQPVEVGLTSLLIDGTRKQTLRYDNRVASFLVTVNAPDAAALAAGEAALWRAAQSAGTCLTWTPPDYFGVPTVFEVETTHLEFKFDDMNELRLRRTYLLSWDCRPFPRSVEPTVMPAVASAGTVIDDCSSLTGWSAETGTIAVSAGAVVNTRDRQDWGALRRTGAIDLTLTPYLVVEWSCSVPMYIDLRDSATFTGWREAYRENLGATTRSYFTGGSSIDAAGFRVGSVQGQTSGTMTFSIHEVSTAATLPDSGTAGHQQLLVIASGGSARTQAQIEVTTPTNGLGEVTLYTAPMGNAYTPTTRRWLSSSDAVITSSGGNYQTITGASIFQVPVSTLPQGGYTVWARMAALSTDEVDIVWNAQTYIGGTTVGDYQGDVTTCAFDANVWKMYPLGMVTLPPAKVGPSGMVQVGIQRSGGETATVYLYDMFLFHEDGDLTVVNCGSGTSAPGGPSRRMRVLPPSAANPGGLLEMGHSTDWSDTFAAGAAAKARPPRGHVLHPEGTSVFVYTESTPDGTPASVSATWHKRWHTHAGD